MSAEGSRGKVSVPGLVRMKEGGTKIVAAVAWDYQMARIVDRVGVELVSVGDSVGVNLWGHEHPLEVSLDEMLVVGKAVRRGVQTALVSIDFPFGPLQEGGRAAVRAAIRMVKEAGADVVKLDGAADYPSVVETLTRAGIPVWAQFGITPHTASRFGFDYGRMLAGEVNVPEGLTTQFVDEARRLEQAGAALLNFTGSGPVVGPAVVEAVAVPVLGGLGGGPWLDGRVRMSHAAIGYAASMLDEPKDTYANVAQTAFDAMGAYAADVRASRQIRSGTPGR